MGLMPLGLEGGLNKGRLTHRFIHTKRPLDAWGVGGFAGGRLKKSVKNRFLTKQVFEI